MIERIVILNVLQRVPTSVTMGHLIVAPVEPSRGFIALNIFTLASHPNSREWQCVVTEKISHSSA